MTPIATGNRRAKDNYYPGLASLRGIAAIGVVTTHVAFWSGSYANGLLGAMAHRLEVGVPIFFALSGFLLARPYYRSLLDNRALPSTSGYAIKRVSRVYPVYFLSVVMALLLIPANRELGIGRWISNLLGYDYYVSDELPHGLTQMWSLYVEVSFYVALPILMLMLRATHASRSAQFQRIVLVMVSLASIAWVAAGGSQLLLPAYALWFAAGMHLALVEILRGKGNGYRSRDRLGRIEITLVQLARFPGTCWLVALSAFVIVSTPIAGPAALALRTPAEMTSRLLLYTVVAVAVIVPSVFGDPGTRYAQFMAHPLLQRLGLLSYSVFCIHVIVLEVVTPLAGFELFRASFLPLLGFVLATSIALSWLIYAIIEKPAIRWGHERARRVAAKHAAKAMRTHT